MKKSKSKPGVAPAPPGEGEFSLIPRDKLLSLYAAMLKCRAIARHLPTASRRQRKGSGRSGSVLISEAVSAGVTIDLRSSDAISPAPSDLTPCAVKGVALKPLLRWWSNSSIRIPARVARACVIPPSPQISARLEAALRLAGHFRAANDGSVVVFFAAPNTLLPMRADAPNTSLELLQSFFRQAAEEQLPILFVAQCDQGKGDLLSIAQHCGVPGVAVDCDDVVAVYRVAFEALSHARLGNGPTLIDSRPWSKNGRNPKKPARDSVDKMELYLAGKGIAFLPVKHRILKEIAAQLGN
jgi:pyruvate dehydrogenase E1 component alpha subunit